jgi:hypothetical protein
MSKDDQTSSAAEVVPPPVKSPYEEIAEEVVADIQAALAKVPRFNDDLSWMTPTVRRRVSPEFIHHMLIAAEDNDRLRGSGVLDAMDCRDALQYAQAMRQLRTMLEGLIRRIDLTVRQRESRASRQALDLYAILCRLLKNPDNSDLRPLVETLRADLRRARIGRQPKRKDAAE